MIRTMKAHSTDNEILAVVDSEDNVVAHATRREIHARGLMHRAVHVFVFNSAGAIYVQRRCHAKDKHPGVLDSSAAGHVDRDESYEEAAMREIHEELGITPEIRPVFKVEASELTDREHVLLYESVTDALPVPNPREITWGGFMRPDELSKAMETKADDFVPVFIHLWKEYRRVSG